MQQENANKDLNCHELRASIFAWFQECAVNFWLENNEEFRRLKQSHEQCCGTERGLRVWEERLSVCYDLLSDLVTGHAINTGLWLAYHSLEYPLDLSA